MEYKEALKKSRAFNKEMLKGKKADFVIGSFEKHFKRCRTEKCCYCGETIYLADKYEDIKDMVKKKHKYICPCCVLEHYLESVKNSKLLIPLIINCMEHKGLIERKGLK